MKLNIPEISWHNRDPVLSVDFQQKSNEFYRLATSGTDSHILIWHLILGPEGSTKVEFASDLQRHQKAVNCVRFSPNGEYLASCDDESNIIIWKQKSENDAPEMPLQNSTENENYKEIWITFKTLRGHMDDVYDLSWSIDSSYMISGSIDNSAILWDIQKGKHVGILSDHKGFVQGVTWDPLNKFVATLCSDRRFRVYTLSSSRSRPIVNLSKTTLPFPAEHELNNKTISLYYDDTFKSYFRRLSFSPDGNLIATPAGLIETSNKNINATYIYPRNQLNNCCVAFGKQMAIVVRFCPVLFELRGSYQEKADTNPIFNLPYRMIYAVATNVSVTFYDTEQSEPFAMIANMHYTRLTDLTWSSDGLILIISSTDGYCSIVTFAPNELGKVYKSRDTLYQELVDKSPSILVNSLNKTTKSYIKTPKQQQQQQSKKKKRVALTTLTTTTTTTTATTTKEEEEEKKKEKEEGDVELEEVNKKENTNDEDKKNESIMEVDEEEDEEEEEEDEEEEEAEDEDADDEAEEMDLLDEKKKDNKEEEEEEEIPVLIDEEQKKKIEKENKEKEEMKKEIQILNQSKKPRRVQLTTINSPKNK